MIFFLHFSFDSYMQQWTTNDTIKSLYMIKNNDFVAKIVDCKNGKKEKKVILIVLYEPSIQIFN